MVIACIPFSLMPVPNKDFIEECPNSFLMDCPECEESMWSSPRKLLMKNELNAEILCMLCISNKYNINDSEIKFFDEIN